MPEWLSVESLVVGMFFGMVSMLVVSHVCRLKEKKGEKPKVITLSQSTQVLPKDTMVITPPDDYIPHFIATQIGTLSIMSPTSESRNM